MKLDKHAEAVNTLNSIKDRVLETLKEKRCSEKQISDIIFKEYRKNKLKTKGKPKVIVSFGKNTSEIHHFPKSNKLKEGPIMLDLWAKLEKGHFADLTWMVYRGNPSKEFMKTFKAVVKARNKALKFIKKSIKKRYLPTFFEIDAIARAYLAKKRLGYAFKHKIGHPLGMKDVHGDGNENAKSKEYYNQLKLGQPYTLEPGLYFKNFGIRLENDFCIDKNFRLHTTLIQNKLIKL